MKWIGLVAVSFIVLLYFISIPQSPDPDFGCVDCNIILISLDALRPDHLGCYGYQRNTSENIDVLASQGVLFENAITQAVYTLPSHTSLFLSKYPKSHGVIYGDSVVNDSEIMLAEILKDYGYSTGAFTGGGWLSEERGFNQGFDDFFRYHSEQPSVSFFVTTKLQVFDEARIPDWVEEHQDEKFFLFLHTYVVHDPYVVPEPHNSIYITNYSGTIKWELNEFLSLPGMEGATTLIEALSLSGLSVDPSTEVVTVSGQEDVDYVNAMYDSLIYLTDKKLGALLEILKQKNLSDKTIVIVFADHGNGHFEHGDMGRTPYDEVVMVPLIIKNPKSGAQGIKVMNQVQLIDITPTLLEMVGIEPHITLEGESLIRLIENDTLDPSRMAYTFSDIEETLRTINWKYMRRGDGTLELYNLTEDPKEENNVVHLFPSVVDQFHRILNQGDIGDLLRQYESLDYYKIFPTG